MNGKKIMTKKIKMNPLLAHTPHNIRCAAFLKSGYQNGEGTILIIDKLLIKC